MTTAGVTAEWLEVEKAFGGRPLLNGSVEELREQFAGLIGYLTTQAPPLNESVATTDIEWKPGKKVRVYQPKNGEGKDLPVCIFFHGGGFILGNLDSEDFLSRLVTELANSIVVSVDYDLAPEHKGPAALNDCVDAFLWSAENIASYGGNANKMYTFGGSAGGNLAFSVALKLIDAGKGDLVKGVVSLVPCTVHPDAVPEKYRSCYNSYLENYDVPIINADSMKTFYGAYGMNPEDVYLSPLLHPKLEKLPRVYLASTGLDPLRDDAVVMDKALTEAGVEHQFDQYPGYPHFFWIFPSLEMNKTFIENTIGGISWILGA